MMSYHPTARHDRLTRNRIHYPCHSP
jgi:hypothetical protein